MNRRLPLFNAALCAPCGGACCQRFPGSAAPEDFPDLEHLEAQIMAGHWTLDEWRGDPLGSVLSRRRRRGKPTVPSVARVLIPRPAIRGREGQLWDPARQGVTGGRCTYHWADGCALTFEARPEQCRALRPGPVRCESAEWSSDRSLALRWRPRSSELEAMLDRMVRRRTDAVVEGAA